MLIEQTDAPLPLLDSTRILAMSAFNRATTSAGAHSVQNYAIARSD